MFGVLFALLTALLAAIIVRGRKALQRDPLCALLSSLLVAFCRALFFLADPYYIWERLPALLNGSLYGVVGVARAGLLGSARAILGKCECMPY